MIVVMIVFGALMGLVAPGSLRLGGMSLPVAALLGFLYLLVTVGFKYIVTVGAMKKLFSGGSYSAAVKAYRRGEGLVRFAQAGGIVLLLLFGASDALKSFAAFRIPLACELGFLGLFFASLVLCWRIGYKFDHACRMQVEQDLMLAGMPVRRGWSASEHLEFNIRHNFLFVAVPLGLIMFSHTAITLFASRFDWPDVFVGVLRMAAVAGVFFISPVLLVAVWRTHELQAGPLRERLDRLCGKIGMNYRKILIWNTGGVLANAAVMGLHRSVRYILISDALMEQLTDEQLVSVFGHEAGHVKFGHMFKFVLFIMGMSLLCGSVSSVARIMTQQVTGNLDIAIVVEQLVLTAMLAVMFWQGFGRLSRLLERQSDVYGAQCAALDAQLCGKQIVSPDGMMDDPQKLRNLYGAKVFASALDAIARINGMPRDGNNWRHGSIAHRVDFLARWGSAANAPDIFHAAVRSVTRWVYIMLLAGIVGLAVTWNNWV